MQTVRGTVALHMHACNCVGSACKPQHSLRRGRPVLLACERAALSFAEPCHRLFYRPSAPEEPPLPRFCMLALRTRAVSMTFPLYKKLVIS